MVDKTRKWHEIEVKDVLAILESGTEGLKQSEATRRLSQYGPNELTESKKISPWSILLAQFKNFLIIILLVAVALSAVLGEVTDAIVIFIIVLFAAVLGFIQEYRAEKAMDALKRMAAPNAAVVRDGAEVEIPAKELVPGDILLLTTGDKVPADCRLVEAINLKTEEAALTGESAAAEKTNAVVTGGASIGDRKNMAFAGTSVVYGRARAIVTDTGMTTEFGKIATMLQEVEEEKTPFQINLDKMSKLIAVGSLCLCFILAGIGLLRFWLESANIWPEKVLEMLIWGISLAIAAVPEALPAVVTIALSLGVQKMSKRHALVRKLPAVETLGSTTYICSDKTGTLTQDQMTVKRVYAGKRLFEVSGTGYDPRGELIGANENQDLKQNPELSMLLMAGLLCNDAALENADGQWRIKGDPTEGALIVLGVKGGFNQKDITQTHKRILENPFTSETKRMTTLHENGNEKIAFSKGALEIVLDSCERLFINGAEAPLNTEARQEIIKQANGLAGDAYRVLGLSYKKVNNEDKDFSLIEKSMVFIGMVGMVDPPRAEVKAAIATCDEAGIRTVMITGDHKMTAVAIARELGILKDGRAIDGEEFDRISDKEFDEQVENINVYARVSPAHKLRVIEALTKKGHIVAMTGDGVNDAPALKKADIGIAMGISGTDVTKEAADMILTNDNFASIVAAVEEGRGIFNNIKKFLTYLLSANLGEILLMASVILLGPLFGLPPIPLIPIQILYINLATDGLPAIALSLEPAEKDIMKKKPRPRNQTVFTKEVLTYLIITGIWTALVCFAVFFWSWFNTDSHDEARAMTFVTLILIELFNAINCRSLDKSVFKIGFFKNKWLIYALLWEIVLMNIIIYVPALQGPFGTMPITGLDWIICILAACTIFIVAEIYKRLYWKKNTC